MIKSGQNGLLLLLLAGCGSSSDGSEPNDPGLDGSLVQDSATGAASTLGSDAAAPSDDATVASGTSFSGTLGALGPALPTVGSVMIFNSGETLLYFSSAPLSCADVAESRWLGKQPVGSQVVEIVVKGVPKVQTYTVGPAEVNYAPGGKSSSYEKSASSGSITFTTASAAGPVEGTVTATTSGSPTSNLSGSFHAELCVGGQQY